MVDPVTEREWELWRQGHLREHDLEAGNRLQLASLLDQIRQEAKSSNDVRLEGMNEFRDQLRGQAASFLTNEKYESTSKAGADAIAAIGKEVDRRLNGVETKQANSDGRTAAYAFMFALIPTAIAAVGLIVALLK